AGGPGAGTGGLGGDTLGRVVGNEGSVTPAPGETTGLPSIVELHPAIGTATSNANHPPATTSFARSDTRNALPDTDTYRSSAYAPSDESDFGDALGAATRRTVLALRSG